MRGMKIMDFDDSFDDHYENDFAFENPSEAGADADDMDRDVGQDESGLDPFDYEDPLNAYLFLSDDAQDAIEGTGQAKRRCLSCGQIFYGVEFDPCPECDSMLTEEIIAELDEEIG
jgi:hypothetical protein